MSNRSMHVRVVSGVQMSDKLYTKIEIIVGPHNGLSGWGDIDADQHPLSELTDRLAEVLFDFPLPDGMDPSISGVLNLPESEVFDI